MRPAITLIELLIVIALVGIIAGVGWPSLGGWNCRQDLRNEFENFNNSKSTVIAQKVLNGLNQNEIFYTKKSSNKHSFFEKFFNFFN